jgi:hypothetical protein
MKRYLHVGARYVLILVVGAATAYGVVTLALDAAETHPRGLALASAAIVLLFALYDLTKETDDDQHPIEG